MTTLELANAIAHAVMAEQGRARYSFVTGQHDYAPRLAEAVLRVLHEHSSWFCRVVESETGPTIETPYEQVQQELFR